MNIAQLKSKILDLAVRGKLTEQRPEEGSAEELLERIREEKQRLIAEGKLKKEKPLPEITEDEIPFNIPAGWKWVRLGEICEVISKGTTPQGGKSAFESSSGIKFLKVENILSDGTISHCGISYIPESHHFGVLKRSILQKDDLLISIAGTLGKLAIVRDCDLPLNTNQAIAFVRFLDRKKICIKYIFYILSSNLLKTLLTSCSKVTAIPNLTLEILWNLHIPLSPLAEQKRIVEKIEAIFKQADIIEENRLALKTAVRHTKRRVLDLAVRGKLTEQNEHDRSVDLSVIKQKKLDLYFEIPDNWSFAHLESITKKISSKPYQILESQVLSSGKFPVISQAKEYSIGFSNDEKKVLFHDHPLVIFGDHTTEVKFVKTNFIVGADGVKIFEPTRSIISAEFLFYVLQFYSINLNKNSGYTRHYKYIKNKGIPLPPLAEQKRIVEKIEQIFGVLDIIKKAVEG